MSDNQEPPAPPAHEGQSFSRPLFARVLLANFDDATDVGRREQNGRQQFGAARITCAEPA